MKNLLLSLIVLCIVVFASSAVDWWVPEEQYSCEERLAAYEIMASFDNRGPDEPELEPVEC